MEQVQWNPTLRTSTQYGQAAVTSQLNDSANLATTWYDSNLLAGNLKKYQVLNLGFTQNDVVIETKDNIILLGVVLDSKLNFSEHVISICKKASQKPENWCSNETT